MAILQESGIIPEDRLRFTMWVRLGSKIGKIALNTLSGIRSVVDLSGDIDLI